MPGGGSWRTVTSVVIGAAVQGVLAAHPSEPPVLTLDPPRSHDDTTAPTGVATSWVRRHAQLVLMASVGLIAGVGVSYVALRPDPGISVFSGPPSVQDVARPAGLRGDEGLALPAPFTPTLPATEPASARAALSAFLDAEIADRDATMPGRSAESFALLDVDTQRRLGSVAAWRQTRAARLVPAGADITAERRIDAAAELTVAASRPPSLTPFRGLVAARTTEVWRVERSEAGWRIAGGRPVSSEPQLPSETAAVASAQRWIDSASSCDAVAARSHQLDELLLGVASLATESCAAGAGWRAGDLVAVDGLTDITALVSAYGSGVVDWARAVTVTKADQQIVVVLGPVGDEWRVMGLLPPSGGN